VADIKEIEKAKKANRIGEVLEMLDLTDMGRRLVGHLSIGYRQRVGLAQALLNDPEVLILDEPTRGLDPKQIIEIRNSSNPWRGGRPIVLSTHILPEVSGTCDHVVIIDRGKVVAADTVDNLSQRPRRREDAGNRGEGSPDRSGEGIGQGRGRFGRKSDGEGNAAVWRNLRSPRTAPWNRVKRCSIASSRTSGSSPN
jgi:ABC-type multidrug transport system ATPase subunit